MYQAVLEKNNSSQHCLAYKVLDMPYLVLIFYTTTKKLTKKDYLGTVVYKGFMCVKGVEWEDMTRTAL